MLREWGRGGARTLGRGALFVFLDGAEIGGKAEGEEMKWKCGRVWE